MKYNSNRVRQLLLQINRIVELNRMLVACQKQLRTYQTKEFSTFYYNKYIYLYCSIDPFIQTCYTFSIRFYYYFVVAAILTFLLCSTIVLYKIFFCMFYFDSSFSLIFVLSDSQLGFVFLAIGCMVCVCVCVTYFFLHFEMLFLLHCYLVTVKQNEIDIGKIDEDFRITFIQYTLFCCLQQQDTSIRSKEKKEDRTNMIKYFA